MGKEEAVWLSWGMLLGQAVGFRMVPQGVWERQIQTLLGMTCWKGTEPLIYGELERTLPEETSPLTLRAPRRSPGCTSWSVGPVRSSAWADHAQCLPILSGSLWALQNTRPTAA